MLAGLLTLYLGFSLNHLTVVPPVYEDEPWQASTGLKLAREGVFGSDLFRGLWGSERCHYWFMPLHPLLLAVTYRVAGFGLLQTRLEPVTMGLLTLLLTYALGRRLFDPDVGLVAVAALLLVRTAGVTRSQLTGILFFDFSRIARYDPLVPVLGLAALHTYLSAERRGDWRLHVGAGLLAGFAGLAHVYGSFWIVALLVLAAWNRSGARALSALAAGCAVPAFAYLLYVLRDVPDWIAQTRGYAPRFGVLDPRWYVHNVLAEPHRYGPGLGRFGLGWALRPGFWAAAAAVPLSLAALAGRAWRGARAARAVVVPALLLPALLALLVTLKLANYLLVLAPLAALAASWGVVTAWHWAAAGPRRVVVRVALTCAALAVAVDGGTRYLALERAAAATTPYSGFIARVRAAIPPGSRILGQHTFWFGLESFDFRSIDVPLLLSDARFTSPPRPAQETLDTIVPDVVLLDDRLRAYLSGAPTTDPFPPALRAWMARRAFTLAATVHDPTYGTMEVFCRN
jgi:hypothetical protein